MTQLAWTQDVVHDDAVRERGVVIERDGHAIPGVLWSPSVPSGPQALVLMGHGGSGQKRNERMVMLGHMFAAEYGWYAAAIDGPVHGERGPVDDANHPAYRAMWQNPEVVQRMIADWRATLDALSQLDEVDSTRVGYWGVSMGTMFGVPYVASEHRIRAAVLGKAGMSGPSVVRSGIDRHFEAFAPKVMVPVLFVMQWDDERFDRSGQLELFDRLGSPDKRLHAYPGLHIDNGPEAFEVQAAFLARYV
jgi:dienelactone hydrolase